MMPMTPIGTRMRATSIPVGRLVRSEIAPTGSCSAATCSTPSAMCSTERASSVRRSMKAASHPSLRACATSALLATTMSALRRRSSAAIARSARFLAAVSARATKRDAARAACPISRMYAFTSTFCSMHGILNHRLGAPRLRLAAQRQSQLQELVPRLTLAHALDGAVDGRRFQDRLLDARRRVTPGRGVDRGLHAPVEYALTALQREQRRRHGEQKVRRRFTLAAQAFDHAHVAREVARKQRL